MKTDAADSIILHLAITKEDSNLTIKGMALKLNFTEGYVVDNLERLENKGFIDHEQRRAGARGTKARCYFLTSKGLQLLNVTKQFKVLMQI